MYCIYLGYFDHHWSWNLLVHQSSKYSPSELKSVEKQNTDNYSLKCIDCIWTKIFLLTFLAPILTLLPSIPNPQLQGSQLPIAEVRILSEREPYRLPIRFSTAFEQENPKSTSSHKKKIQFNFINFRSQKRKKKKTTTKQERERVLLPVRLLDFILAYLRSE